MRWGINVHAMWWNVLNFKYMNFPSRRFKTAAEIQELLQTMIRVHEHFFLEQHFCSKDKQKHTLFWARITMILRKIWMKSKNKSTECLEGKENFFKNYTKNVTLHKHHRLGKNSVSLIMYNLNTGPGPERPISANSRLKFCSKFCIYLPTLA